ncbi:MAG: DNA mismatch repair protein MutS [Planctomycetota bacterium]
MAPSRFPSPMIDKTTLDSRITPMMEQWARVKREHPDSLLFFRMGDFFELFHEDARTAARVLGLALTSRSKEKDAVPMAGVPVRSTETYLRKLIAAGYRVIVCDQVQDPREAKGLVDRAVTRIVTAGTITEEEILARESANYLLALHRSGKIWGLAWAELSTGLFRVAQASDDQLAEEVSRLAPAEILLAEQRRDDAELATRLRQASPATLTYHPTWTFDERNAFEAVGEHFGVSTLQGFGLDERAPYVGAAGAVLRYLAETQKTSAHHLDPPTLVKPADTMFLDTPTRRCLELLASARAGRTQGTLVWCLDRTTTAMGARLLREHLLAPRRDLETIRCRLGGCRELVDDPDLLEKVREALRGIYDIERLTAKIVLARASARDLVNVRESLAKVPHVKELLVGAESLLLAGIEARIVPLDDVRELLERAIQDSPPLALHEGGIIRDGFHEELDRLNKLRREGHSCLGELQQREIERTGIKNLRVGYNRVFGFYIEVTRTQGARVPDHYIRKQTLKNVERYITPELKEHETQVLTADERAKDLEYELFEEVRLKVACEAARLRALAAALAELDVVQSLASAAREHSYVEPEMLEAGAIEIEEGRHPVLAATLGIDRFVPNDCVLGGDHPRTHIITGPNMAGKSTYLRQVALTVIMAQIGSFVPAKRARLPVVDRIFTRVGASDDLVEGASTFMVEMTETANILHNATSSSLVLLDEVGRGTSTYDGVALAWAIAEHLHRHTKAMTLFATHYHQLTALADEDPGIRNMNIAVKEWGQEIVFLHHIVEGGTDRSYGVHVARLAGVPEKVITRARGILKDLERRAPLPSPPAAPPDAREQRPQLRQLLLFDPPAETIAGELRRLDPNTLTPLQALQKLQEWKQLLDGEGR